MFGLIYGLYINHHQTELTKHAQNSLNRGFMFLSGVA